MFGSDWPVCTLAATYDEVYDIVNEYIFKLSPNEQADIMGETATRFYQLKD
jgi:L-fuconolactonase